MSKTKLSMLALLLCGTSAASAGNPAPSSSAPIAPSAPSPTMAATAAGASAPQSYSPRTASTTLDAVPPALAPVKAAAPTLPPDATPSAGDREDKPFTLGEVEYKQGNLARARMDAEIAKARADARGADNSSPLPNSLSDALPGAKPGNKVEMDPTRDFTPYGYYKFGKSACADILYRGALYTRCAGDAQTLEGWRLVSLTPEKAEFVKGHETRALAVGVSLSASH